MISEVINELERAVALNPRESEYQRILGWAKIISGDHEDGIKHVKKAVRLNRKNVYAYADLASYYLRANQFDRARKALSQGISAVPDSPFLLRAKAVVERTRRDYRRIKEEEKKTKLRIVKVKDPEFHKVRKSLLMGMSLSRYSKAQKTSAEKIWYDFYRLRKLRVKRPEVWAAALEYTIIRLDLIEGRTQRGVARKYSVSESVLSSRFNDICRTLNIKVLDRRYTTGEDSLLDMFDLLLRDE
jgi:Flp pilus assembly protein TadD, contains TPR repeats